MSRINQYTFSSPEPFFPSEEKRMFSYTQNVPCPHVRGQQACEGREGLGMIPLALPVVPCPTQTPPLCIVDLPCITYIK